MRALIAPAAAMVLAIVAAPPAVAQETPGPGDRVRITVPGLYTDFTATFLGVEGDSLRVQSRSLVIAVPVDAVVSVERSIARRPRFEAVLIGTVGGAAAGWIVASFMGLCDTVDSVSPDSGACVPLVIGSFGIGGAAAGLLFAVTNPDETWAPATLPRGRNALGRLSLSVDPELGTTVHVSAVRIRF